MLVLGVAVAVVVVALCIYLRNRPTHFSPAQQEYLAGFSPDRLAEPFVQWHVVGSDKSLQSIKYTRGEFLELALRACRVLRDADVQAGQSHVHYFSCNTIGDLAFRLASVLCGTTPVTINWQADTAERVVYKARVTTSKLILFDDETPADVLAMLTSQWPASTYNVARLPFHPPLSLDDVGGAATAAATSSDASRIIIFTSGTTGNPKGVQLPYKSYRCNRQTFESFLEVGSDKRLVAVVVNPMHHTNSTAITDWAIRKPGATLHLVQRYTTQYWTVVARAGTELSIEQPATDAQLMEAIKHRHADGRAVVVCPLVSRHFDFLDGLWSGAAGTLPVSSAVLKHAMSQTILLVGSAPVGPTTVSRMQKYAGRLPIVRFGSTETCLQVLGTPLYLSEEARLAAFKSGWSHTWKGQPQVGYYIGRPHKPFTDCRIVTAASLSGGGKYVECEDGEPGQLITRGDNVMSGYVGNSAATKKALGSDGWYTNLGDVCFRLRNPADGGHDYYWLSRDSALLIRGGANYSYEQINNELQAFVAKAFGLPMEQVEVAVIGLRLDSEHEDSCCVTIELSGDAAGKSDEVARDFLELARKGVSKGAKPDRVRLAALPRNFKGVVKLPDLKEEWAKERSVSSAEPTADAAGSKEG